jgi:hypothetical protein
MWRAACLLVLAPFVPAAMAASPPAATSLTVTQLDELLAGLHKKNDAGAARELAGLKLTERAGAAWLAKWEQEFPGSRTREVLLALVDDSAFLHPPAAEIPSNAAPDDASQKQMLTKMIAYVEDTLPKLPNFLALRSTTAFEITTGRQLRAEQEMAELYQMRKAKQLKYHALGPAKSSGLEDAQLFWLGSSAETVTYRSGAEVAETPKGDTGKPEPMLFNMTTTGEFGPILEVFLHDAPMDKTVWDRWERGATGTLAVFRYIVPRENSHFGVVSSDDQQVEFPAYHGEITIDPETGAIFRIVVLTSGRGRDFSYVTSYLVEFAPTQIAGVIYTCPVRGVAMTKRYDALADQDAQSSPIPFQISINDTAFSDFHVFRTKSRVVSGAQEP